MSLAAGATKERRGLCQAPDTRLPPSVQKVDVGTSFVRFSPPSTHTAGEVDTLPFRAAIWNRLAVDWWLSGPPTYFVSRRLQI